MAELTDELAQAIAGLEEEKVLALVGERLAAGVEPLAVVAALQEGMTKVGSLFESGEYFLSELIMAGEIMKDAMTRLEPHLVGKNADYKGNIVIGTVKGDIHDLGKNIVVMLLRGAGYNVIDLGVDVPPEKFVAAIREHQAPLVGLSVLLTACQAALKETVTAIREAGLDTKVVVGGNYIDEKVRQFAGADYIGTMASDGVKVAEAVFVA